MNKEELNEFLKAAKDAGFEVGGVNLHTISLVKKSEGAGNFQSESECSLDTLVVANARLARSLETSTTELSRVLNMLNSFVKENESLRRCLGEK